MSLTPTLSINGYPAIKPTRAKVPSHLATAWCYFIKILGGRSYSTDSIHTARLYIALPLQWPVSSQVQGQIDMP